MSSGAQNLRVKQIVKNYLDSKDEPEEGEKKNEYIDYYGFYHSPQALSEKQLKQESISRENDIHRFQKWSKMVGRDGKAKHENNWNKYFPEGKSTEKLKRRIYKGIPNLARTIVWPLLLRVSDIKLSHKRNTFNNLFQIALEKSEFLEQIDLDINRTYRNTSYFVSRFGARQRSLFKLLAAYSVYNPEIGYCQGLSDIAGILLMYIHDEEDAFWAFCQLLNGPKHSMHGIFVNNFPGLNRLFVHHEKVIERLLPNLFNYLKKENVITTTYALKWFMQCFIGRMPISLTFRLWDIYLLEGEKLLIGQAYNILKMHKKNLMTMDACNIMTYLQDELSKDFLYSDEDVIDSLKECLETLHKNRLDVLPQLTADMKPHQPLGQILETYRSDIWETKNNDQTHHTLTHSSSKNYQSATDTPPRQGQFHSWSAYNTLDNPDISNRKIDMRYSERNSSVPGNSDQLNSVITNHRIINDQTQKVITNFSGTNGKTQVIKKQINNNLDEQSNEDSTKSLSVILSNGVTNPLFSGPISPPLSDTCSSINPDSTKELPQPSDTIQQATPLNNNESVSKIIENTRQINSISGVPRQFDYSSSSLMRNSNRSLESNYSQLIGSSPEKRSVIPESTNSSLPRRDLEAEHQARTYVIASVLCDSVERRVNQSFGQPSITTPSNVDSMSKSPHSPSSPDFKAQANKSNDGGVWIQRDFDTLPSDNIQINQGSNSRPLTPTQAVSRIPLVYDISQITNMMNPSPPSSQQQPNKNSIMLINNTDGKTFSQGQHTPTSRTCHKPTPEQKHQMLLLNQFSNRYSYQPTAVASLDRNSAVNQQKKVKIRSLIDLEDYPLSNTGSSEKQTFIIDSEQIDYLIEKTYSSLRKKDA